MPADEEQVLLIEDVFSAVLSAVGPRADPIHPNGPGYRALAEGVAAELQSAGLLL